MRTGSMVFSLLQVPRCRIHSLANCWGEAFNSFSKTYGNNSSVKLLSSRIYGLQGGHRKKWTQRPITTNTEGTKSTKSRRTKNEILSETILASATANVNNKAQLDQFQEIQYCDVQEIARDKDLSSLITVIVFDIETTGLSREKDRIIEIALRDLEGGENSTFQTLVNPERRIFNSDIHGITTEKVNSPDVPRMEDLIPILLEYVKSRQKPGGYVLLVGHNARNFDVPFISNELHRCSIEVPPNWLFLDTLPLARQLVNTLPLARKLMNSEVFTGTNSTKPPSASLKSLSELYSIKVDGSAHRAMVDVNTLSSILPMLTCDLKLTLSDLVKKSFRESDLINSKRKKNS